MNKLKLARLLKNAQSSVIKHSPEILTGLGIAGMITSTVLAVKATPKALKLIEEEKEREEVDELTALETVKVAWKPYIPAIATTIVSTACLIGASSVSARRYTALTAAYKLSESALAEYHEKVVESIGETKERVIRDKVNQEQIDKNPINNSEIYITKEGDTTFLDPLSKRYFKCDIDLIRKTENKLNKEMLHDPFGYVSLNDFYDEIGLDRTDLGDKIGWNIGKGMIDIHISPGLTKDDKPCIVLDFTVPPAWDFDKFD